MANELRDIIARLEKQHESIGRALAVLREIEEIDQPAVRRGRPPGVKAAAKKSTKRVLSPEARKRIADAQRKRWAAQKRAIKKAR